jgi:hypothetical protein
MKFLQYFRDISVLTQSDGFEVLISGHPHTEDPLAWPQVFHFESINDGFLEKSDIGAYDYQIVYMYVHKTGFSRVMVNKETRVGRCGMKVD